MKSQICTNINITLINVALNCIKLLSNEEFRDLCTVIFELRVYRIE